MKFLTLERILYSAAIIILCAVFIPRSCNDPNVEVKKPELKPTVQKTDKKGTTYTEIQGTLYTPGQIKHLTDSLRKVLGKGKVTQVETTVTTIDTFTKHDTLFVNTETGEIYAADSNGNYKISYVGNYKTDTGSFHLKIKPDTATRVTAVRNPLIGRSTMTVNEYHTNSLFIPSMGSAYTVKASRTLLVIGPCGGAGWFTGSSGVGGFVGGCLTIPVISIKAR